MKIVHFNSGLGNQIFQLMFAEFLRSKGYKVYGYYNKKWLKQHNGLEVYKVINAKMPSANIISNLVAIICRCIHRIDKKGRFFSTDNNYNENGLYYSGYWQDIRFYSNLPKPLFNQFDLSETNRNIRTKMIVSNSVSVHIRRGDYLTPDVIGKLGNICTIEYYKKAIMEIKKRMDNPFFFVFSDDIEWAKENILEKNTYYVDWNNGENSYIDMYLMSFCKAHIIANSSFSYWGAYMSEKNIVTVYPGKWFNNEPSPNIAPSNWVKIDIE